MPISYGFIAEHDLNWMALMGRVTCSDALGFPAGLDPSRSDVSTTWIVFVDPQADLSELTAGCISNLHRAMRPVTQALARKGAINVVWACDARVNATFVSAWRAYLNADVDYPSRPRAEKTLAAAARTAGLDETAYEAIRLRLEEQWVSEIQVERL